MDVLSLLDSFGILGPDSDPNLSLGYLDSLLEQQLLRGREEKDVRKFISSVNVCLGNPRSRSIGLKVIIATHVFIFLSFEIDLEIMTTVFFFFLLIKALGILLEQASDECFSSNCKSWTQTILQSLKSHSSSLPSTESFSNMSIIFQRARDFPELSKYFSTTCPTILTTLLDCLEQSPASTSPAIIRALNNLLISYPGSCGSGYNGIEKAMFKNIHPAAKVDKRLIAETFSILPRYVFITFN